MSLIYLPIIILSILILGRIVYQDIKAREINLTYLIILGILSIAYLGIFIFKFNLDLWKNYLFQIIIVFVFLLIFYVLGRLTKFAYIGEGDLYTIFALSFTNIYSSLFVVFIFLVALLFMLGIPILLFIYNLIRGNYPRYPFFQSLLLMFLGVPQTISKLTEFYTPLEHLTYNGGRIKRELCLRPNFEPKTEISKLKELAAKHKIKRVWASHLIPFVLLILLSYIFMIILVFLFHIPIVMNYISFFF